MNDFEERMRHGKKFYEQGMQIVSSFLGTHLKFHIVEADEYADQYEATDFKTVIHQEGRFGFRVRGPGYWEKYFDFTMRYRTRSGSAETEFKKLKNDVVPFYFYCWESASDPSQIGPWMFLDLKKVREAGLFEKCILRDPPGCEPWMQLSGIQLVHAGAILESSFDPEGELIRRQAKTRSHHEQVVLYK
jgi:hypothetical protein